MGGSQSTPAPAEPLAINNNAPKRNTGEADTVIIPVDGSKQSEAAFLWYLNHVHRKDNILHIRHCQELNQGAPLRSEHSYGFQSQTWSEIVEERKVEGMKIVEKYEGKLAEHNLKGTVEFSLADRPGEYLIDQTEHLKGSMIVMGTRGFGVLRRTILGSVSNYVIHHSKVPVTVVPPETQSWFF